MILEGIVTSLSSTGELNVAPMGPLVDESLALFERGQARAAQCARLLEAAELKVKQLAPDGSLEDLDLQED